MPKISLLTPAFDLVGDEQVVLVKDGVTRRAAVSGLVGASVAPFVQTAEFAADTALAASNFYGTAQYGSFAAAVAAGELATPAGSPFSVDDGDGSLVYFSRTAGGSVEIARSVTPANLLSPQGSQRIGYRQSSAASIEYLDAVVRRIGFFPQSYGALADAETDDAEAINAANDAAELARGKLVLEGTYLIKSQLKISVPIEPKPGAKIIIAEDFSSPSDDTIIASAIINKYIALEYNPATALYWEISSRLEIEMRSETARQVMTLANVNGGAMNSPLIWTNTNVRCDALIDFYGCCREIDVYSPELSNITGASGGASSWIRAITTAPTNPANDTYGIRFHGGRLQHATGDEAIAVFGVFGRTRGIRIKDLTIEALISFVAGTRHSTLVSAFPLNNGGSQSVAQGDLHATVEDVIFDGLRINDARFLDNIYRTGREEDAFNICRDIHLVNSIIHARQETIRPNSIMRHVPCVGDNVTIDNVTAIATNAGQVVTNGAVGFDLLTRSTILGNVNNAAAECINVTGNKKLIGLVHGVDNCRNVVGNDLIQAPAYPIQVRSTANYRIARNELRSTNTSGGASGILINSLGGATVPSGSFEQNSYDCSGNSSALLATPTGAIGTFDVLRNIGTGGGFHGLSSNFRRVEGNDRFGTSDPEQNVLVGDADVALNSARYQLVIFNSPITADRLVIPPGAGVTDGQHFRLIRTAAATGEYNINIAGGLGTLPAAGWIDVARISGAWVRVGQGT